MLVACTPSSLTSSSSGDYEKIDYKPKFTAAEAKLIRSAVAASGVADTGRPDSDEVRLRQCARAKLLSVRSIPDLDSKLLVTTKATHPFSLLFPTRAHTAEHTSRARDQRPSDTALPATTSVPRPPPPLALWNWNLPCVREAPPHKRYDLCHLKRVCHGLTLRAAVCLHNGKGSWWQGQGIDPAVGVTSKT